MKKSRLGRGIDAIFPEQLMENKSRLVELSIEDIFPNPIQPRKEFDEETIEDLSKSISQNGILAPIVVRRVDSRYEIIAGERRYRAAKKAGLDRIPSIVRDCQDDESFRLSLIENVQREDLNAMDECEAYHTLYKQFQHTHQDIADAVSKDRSTITNSLRLMGLPEEAKQALRENRISNGHARAILMIDNYSEQLALLKKIEEKNLSVREAERLASSRKKAKKDTKTNDTVYERYSLLLSENFSTKVTCSWSKKKGKITFEFNSKESMEKIATWLSTENIPE